MKILPLSAVLSITASLTHAAATLADPQSAPTPTTPKVIVHGKNVPRIPVALWEEDGKRKSARGADAATAPPSAAIVYAKILDLGGPNIREVIVPAGVLVTAPSPPTDVLIYVLKGHAQVTVGDQSGKIGPGDAMRELAGIRATFRAIDEVLVVESDLPVGH